MQLLQIRPENSTGITGYGPVSIRERRRVFKTRREKVRPALVGGPVPERGREFGRVVHPLRLSPRKQRRRDWAKPSHPPDKKSLVYSATQKSYACPRRPGRAGQFRWHAPKLPHVMQALLHPSPGVPQACLGRAFPRGGQGGAPPRRVAENWCLPWWAGGGAASVSARRGRRLFSRVI